jgi:hypothetical protein
LFASLAIAVTFVGCASVGRINQTAEKIVRESITQSEVNRCTVHAQPCLTDEQFVEVNLELNKVAVAGREFTKLEIAGKATTADAAKFLSTVSSEVTILTRTFPTGAVHTVLVKLTELQAQITKIIGKL